MRIGRCDGVAASKEKIEKQREENRRAIQEADAFLARLDWVLRDSERRSERIMANLRRAGLLRD
jgi:phosphoribosylformylglycinamidine (FGAM) synthase-like enzyme